MKNQSTTSGKTYYSIPTCIMAAEAMQHFVNREMRRHFAVCDHPDHTDEHDCLDRSVGCSKHCLCCMGELAVPFPNISGGCPHSTEEEIEAYRARHPEEQDEPEGFDSPIQAPYWNTERVSAAFASGFQAKADGKWVVFSNAAGKFVGRFNAGNIGAAYNIVRNRP